MSSAMPAVASDGLLPSAAAALALRRWRSLAAWLIGRRPWLWCAAHTAASCPGARDQARLLPAAPARQRFASRLFQQQQQQQQSLEGASHESRRH